MSPMQFGLRQSMRWVLSFGRRACWIWKWTEIWRGCDCNHCNAIVSPPLKGRVVADQGSAESGVRFIRWIAGEAGHTSEKHPWPEERGMSTKQRSCMGGKEGESG